MVAEVKIDRRKELVTHGEIEGSDLAEGGDEAMSFSLNSYNKGSRVVVGLIGCVREFFSTS